MKILVTGAAGFIGSHVAQKLLQRGDQVIALDNFAPNYSRARKAANLKEFVGSPNCAFIEADIRDAEALRHLFLAQKFDRVIHLAAMGNVRYSIEHAPEYAAVNIVGTVNLLEAARLSKVQHVVFASTSSIYGNADVIPFIETASAAKPLAPYPATKIACEVLAHSYHVAFGMKCVGLRFFNVYGPRGRPDMMPYVFTEKISTDQKIRVFGAGKPQRDWTYIDDIVGGVIAAIDSDLDYEIINLGRGQPIVLARFIDIIERLVGRRATIEHAPLPSTEPVITYANIDKATRLLNYQPQTSIEDGLAKFYEWYKSHRISESASQC
jgi:UDP-glucuronate 4-epimerase